MVVTSKDDFYVQLVKRIVRRKNYIESVERICKVENVDSWNNGDQMINSLIRIFYKDRDPSKKFPSNFYISVNVDRNILQMDSIDMSLIKVNKAHNNVDDYNVTMVSLGEQYLKRF